MKKLVYLTLLVSCLCFQASANHMIAGRIYYQWVSGTIYKIIIEKYYECGVTPSTNIPLCSKDITNSYWTPGIYPLHRDTIIDVSVTCDTISSSCTVSNSPYIGWKMIRYSCMFDFSGPFHWVVGHTECCFATLDNMDLPTATETVYFASIYLDSVAYNNSVYTPVQPLFFVPVNQPQQLDFSGVDPDCDSLVYAMEPAWEQFCDLQIPAAYAPGLDYLNPIHSNSSMYIDPVTGIFSFTPSTLERDLVVYSISEYRNGVLCGVTHRTVQIIVTADPNQIPNLSGINGTSNYHQTICAGDSVNFNIYSSDPDLNSTKIKHYSFNNPNGILDIIPGLNESGNFHWITDSSDAAITDYMLNVTLNDDNCPYSGAIAKTYTIHVNSCPNNMVWPGDANTDKLVDATDLLPIGIAYGETGPVRNSPSLVWTAQPAQGWSRYLANGVDYKHCDSDGNGVVDSMDIQGIYTNFGQSHLRIGTGLTSTSTITSGIKITLAKDTIAPGETINGTVSVGDAGNLFNGYGG